MMASPRRLPLDSFSKDIQALLERDGDRCVWCSRKLAVMPGDCTREHVVPRSKGGRDILDNYLLACQSCNSQRKSKLAQHWLRVCEQEGRAVQRDLVEAAIARAEAGDVVRPSKLSRRARLARSKRLRQESPTTS